MTGTIVRGKLTRADLALWDGRTTTATRVDATGGTVTGVVIGSAVDVLQVFGEGTARARGAIVDAVQSIGSAAVTLEFAPGAWTIDDDLTVPSNFICRIPSGCIFSIDSGKTLTFYGPVYADSASFYTGSGSAVLSVDSFVGGKPWIARTAVEITNGVTPSNYHRREGDLRRYSAITFAGDVIDGHYSYGDVPTYIDADTFTVPGDKTAIYEVGVGVIVVSASAWKTGYVSSVSYSSPTTTVNVAVDYNSSLPTSPLAVGVAKLARTDIPWHWITSQNTFARPTIQNRSTGTAATAGQSWGVTGDSGLVLMVSGVNYSGELVSTSGVTGNCVAFYTTTTGVAGFVAAPLVFAYGDQPRIVIGPAAGGYPNPPPVKFINAAEAFRLHSTGATGDSYQSWYRSNGTTQKGYFGYDSAANQNLRLVNLETGTIEITASAGNASLNSTTGSVSLNGVSYSMTLAGLGNYANDAAAAAGGVPVSGLYRNGSVLMIRVA